MPSEEACFVLGYERTGASAEDGDLLLNFQDIILAGFKINLQDVNTDSTDGIWSTHMLDCDHFSSGAINCLVNSSKAATSELLQHRVLIRHGAFRRHIAGFAKQERWVLGMRRAILTRRSSEIEKGWSGKVWS